MDSTATKSTTSCKRVLLPLDLLVLLDLEELAPLGIVLNYWVEDIGIGEPLPVELVFLGSKSHFGLAKDEREEPVLLALFCCREMASKGRELLNEVSHIVEGGLPHDCVKRGGFHLPSHHFCNGCHGCHDCCHVCAICVL